METSKCCWQFRNKLNAESFYNPTILLLSIPPKELKTAPKLQRNPVSKNKTTTTNQPNKKNRKQMVKQYPHVSLGDSHSGQKVKTTSMLTNK